MLDAGVQYPKMINKRVSQAEICGTDLILAGPNVQENY